MSILAAAIFTAHAVFLGIFLSNVRYLRRTSAEVEPGSAPPLSVLIPARNEAANLRRLLPSLLDQSYADFEVVVYDDGSEDATWQVLQAVDDERLRPVRGEGPPPGWVGKVHALYQAARVARGDLYLFLDADAELRDREALARLAARFAAQPAASVMTGFTRLCGGGLLLVSLVPSVMLTGLPWPLVGRTAAPSLAALNGQCWIIDAAVYHRFEPHRSLPGEVLEDVQIGRFLKGRGVPPVMVDVQREVNIYMYRDFGDAWQGFRKNAYLILGGTPAAFAGLYLFFVLVYPAAPFVSPWLLLTLYALKTATDRRSGFPLWVSALAPLSFVLGSLLQLHSAISHWMGAVQWKGRQV